MNKIPIKVEREVLTNFLDSLLLRGSKLKNTDWYNERFRKSKAGVNELILLRLSLWSEALVVLRDKTIIKFVDLFPPGTSLRIFHFLVRIKRRYKRPA